MCGAVKFSFTDQPRFVSECVCEYCRRAHGASVVAWVGVKEPQFKFLAGASTVSWYHSSTDSERGFCQQCGTRLFFKSKRWAGEMHMALACIDEPHDLKSTEFSFVNELPDWTCVKV